MGAGHLEMLTANWSPGQAVAPCLMFQAGLCGEHGAPRVETTTPLHSVDCGTAYRGCAPGCPKDAAEREARLRDRMHAACGHDDCLREFCTIEERDGRGPVPPAPAPAAEASWRKRPAVVTAVRVTDEWFDGDHPNDLHPIGLVMDPVRRVVEIPTLEGTMTGQVGDWIITGVKGERYPIKNEIFLETYEEAGDAEGIQRGGGHRGRSVAPLCPTCRAAWASQRRPERTPDAQPGGETRVMYECNWPGRCGCGRCGRRT